MSTNLAESTNSIGQKLYEPDPTRARVTLGYEVYSSRAHGFITAVSYSTEESNVCAPIALNETAGVIENEIKTAAKIAKQIEQRLSRLEKRGEALDKRLNEVRAKTTKKLETLEAWLQEDVS